MRPPPGGVRGGRDRDVDRVDWWDPPGEVGGEVGGEWRGGLPLPPPERRRTPATAPFLPYCPTLPPGGEEEEEEREAVEGGAGFLRVRRTGVRPRGGGRGWPTWPTPTPTPTLRPERSWGDDLDRGGLENAGLGGRGGECGMWDVFLCRKRERAREGGKNGRRSTNFYYYYYY